MQDPKRGDAAATSAFPLPDGEQSGAAPLSPRASRLPVIQDLLIALSLAAFCLLHRIETLEPVNTGGDAATKWLFVRQWFYRHDFAHAEWNHHMTRFGVLVPAYLAQLVFGHGLRGYYAAPLCACVVQVIFVYGCGKRLSGRFAGVLAALILIYTSVMATAGSQLLPDLFTGTYGIVMTYLFLRFADAQGKTRTAWLVASAVIAFIGYLAKETMVFFYPGMALAIWGAARHAAGSPQAPSVVSWRAVIKPLAIFFGVLLVGLVLETLAYRVFTQYHSRASIVVASHIGNSDEGGRPDTTFWKLFDRYLHIDKGWVVAFYVFLPCWLGLLGFAKNYRVRGMLAVVASFFFFLTFLVRGINPMLLWQRFMSRYLDPTAPFVELVTALFVTLVLRQLWQERGTRFALLDRLARYGAWVAPALVMLLAVGSYSNIKEDGQRAFATGSELAEMANDAYARNLPIVIRRPRSGGASYARDILALYAIYIDPAALVRGGRMPPFEEARRVSGSMTYLVKNPRAYNSAKVSALIDAGCALEVRETTPTMTAAPWGALPASCRAPGAN